MYPEENRVVPTTDRCVELRKPTLRERLEEQRVSLSAQLADVEKAILAIERNPEMLEALNCLSRVRGIGY